MTTSATTTVTRQKFAGENLPFEIDLGQRAATAWGASADVAANDIVRPSSSSESADGAEHQTGFVYQASAAGRTGPLEPAWPTTVGGTVTDGSITWTAVVPPPAGGETIQSATWTQDTPPDAALNITGESAGSLVASAYLGGGTVGSVYTIVVAVTMTSGAIYVVKIILTVL